MAGHQVTYKSEKIEKKAVYFTGTDTLQEGYPLCYDADSGTAADVDYDRAVNVEKPASGNLEHFAGVVTEESAGTVGPAFITIHVPTVRGQKVKIWTDQNCVIDVNLLTLVADSYVAQEVGDSPIIIGQALQTIDRSTPGPVLARLSLPQAQEMVRLKVGAYPYPDDVSTDEANVKFWELWTKSTSNSGTSMGIYWWHGCTGTAGGKAAEFTLYGEAALNQAIGVAGAIFFGSSAGSISGLGCGVRAIVNAPNRDIGGGAVNALQAEWYAGGGNTSASVGNKKTFLRFLIDGNSSGKTQLNGELTLFDIDGVTVGSATDGTVVEAISGDKAVTHLAHIKINDVDYYIMLRNGV